MRCVQQSDQTVPFEEWRCSGRVIEFFGFDPYTDRQTDVVLMAPKAAGLLAVQGDVLDILDDLKDRTGLETDEVVRRALYALNKVVAESELRVQNMVTQAKLIARAIRGELDEA